jgi:transketolase
MSTFISRPYYETLKAYGAKHRHALCLMGDLTKSCEAEGFQETFPERYFNFGMAEANLIGAAGGMAKEGFLPIVHTFGVFITRRAYDQVQMSIGVPHRRVRLMGFLPGITTPGGVTHQAVDDVAVMGSVPGMTIVDPGDASEIRSVLDAVHDVGGPVFCRMVRGDVPVLFDTPMVFGKARVLSKGKDVVIISSSVGTWEAIAACETLKASGISVAHLHCSTLKPFNDPAVMDAIASAKAVVTVENHLIEGGLGSRVAELIAEHGLAKRLKRLGLDNRYGGAGSQSYMIDNCGFAARHIVAAVETLLDKKISSSRRGIEQGGDGDLTRQEAL